ncbi:MAG: Xaa-Pro peptidase family protein [Tannerella sp.]|jgi:Xaa-Pro aminopeptidase|nr:Xaa-Pro peptidase family protein [Tannerella sp.]
MMDFEPDLAERNKNVQAALGELNVDGCLLSVDVQLYYLTGRVFNGYYYLPAEGTPVCFVKRPNTLFGKNIVPIQKAENMTDFFRSSGISLPRSLLLETDEITYNECVRLQQVFRNPEIGNATTLMRQMREIKTPVEIDQLRLSACQHAKAYAHIASCYRPGMTDIDFQIEIERVMRMNGSIGVFQVFGPNMNIFMGSVLAGPNAEAASPFDFALGGHGMSSFCPVGANGTLLKEGMAVMVDMAGNFTSYLTDMTRVFAVGQLPELACRAHRVSQDIQAEIKQIARPGIPCAELYRVALARVEKEGLQDYFMGTIQQAKFIGHGIGLQINELPILSARSKEVLLPNMVFALEPKFVIPGVGAVGIENSFLVTETGIEQLTVFEEDIIPLV